MLGQNVLFGLHLQYYLITNAIAEKDSNKLSYYCAPEIYKRIVEWMDSEYYKDITLHRKANTIVDIKRILRYYDLFGIDSISPSEFGHTEPDEWVDMKDPLSLLTCKNDIPNDQK